ncbi:DUF4249 family protein [Mucilaginibacter flavus]|uniref:DUF4249 family protein n=1 Tax=Mucilaginibacter flavus TaxID=931504 RepID=UPI0025B3679C|nr:DUF4249 family protein [Mucilaginibacter flavus]MDN3582520.1 DUF4249 family protein [Mucilaginibacter flavus]
MEIKTYTQNIALSLVVALFALSSCKKNSSDTLLTNKPVVEAYLIPGNNLSVKVYQQKALADTTTYGAALTGLSISVSDGSKSVKLTESASGTYTYVDGSFVSSGKTYTMQFTYAGVNVSAATIMPGKPQNFKLSDSVFHVLSTINPLYADVVRGTITWDNPDSLYHLLVFKNLDNDPFYISYIRSNNKPSFQINTEQAAYHNLVQSSFNYYGHYQVILMRVNKEYINILTTNISRNSQALVNEPTNVTNGLGIFTAMQTDTLSLRVTTE